MATQSLEQQSPKTKRAPQKETRAQRGVALYAAVREAIEHMYGSTYRVPSASGTDVYVVNIERCTCTCPDNARARKAGEACKHLVAGELKHSELRKEVQGGEQKRLRAQREAYMIEGERGIGLIAIGGNLTQREVDVARREVKAEALKPRGERDEDASYVAFAAIIEERGRAREALEALYA